MTSGLNFTGDAGPLRFWRETRRHDLWYHSFYFDNGYRVRGAYDLGRDIGAYPFPPLAGLRVLDVGPASGWFSFWFEQHGAEVTALDVAARADLDFYAKRPSFGDLPGASFETMRRLLNSNVRTVHARVYDVQPSLGIFDLVFMGSVLQHLRDPIGALMALRSVCSGILIATITADPGLDQYAGPLAALPVLGPERFRNHTWWIPNRSAFELWLRASGFASADASRTVTLSADRLRRDINNATQLQRVGVATIEDS
jgi:SAM-dependent methyltransferase